MREASARIEDRSGPDSPAASIAGCDFSTKYVDIVLLQEDTNHAQWHRYPLNRDGDAFDRARGIRTAMPPRGFWEDQGVIAIGIEQPRGRHGTSHLFRIQGGILQCLPETLLVQPWNPADWKKTVGLGGNATKPEIAARAQRLMLREDAGTVPWTQDALDAYLIAYATRSRLEILENAA